MCGRAYSTVTQEELEFRYLNKKIPDLELKPNYNLAPTQIAPIVYVKENERTVEMMRFGLIPAWAKDIKSASKYSLINARAEEIREKKSYAPAFKHRRCILPLSGFYEWHNENGKKRPFAIQMKEQTIISVAAVYEHWTDKLKGEIIPSFAIITCAANSIMSKIHDRMPVILNQSDEEFWLDPKNQDVDALAKLLVPYPGNNLNCYEVSLAVNSPKNNFKELLESTPPDSGEGK